MSQNELKEKAKAMNADAHLNIDALNEAELKRAMGCFATGVTIVTANHLGTDIGMTCNSFNTVSLDPAMVLWSIRKESGSRDAFVNADGYMINILAGDQQETAMQFTRGSHADRFDGVPADRLSSGRLMLTDAVAWFDCALENVVSAGDHDILIGRILSFASTQRDPLMYVKGRFVGS
ncbi:MAG: flavin reductase family protein [Pseudomonadota bacterium]